MIGLACDSLRWGNEYNFVRSYHSMDINWQAILEGNQMGSDLLGFLADSQLSMDLYVFTNHRSSWVSHAIPLSMMIC